MVTPAIIQFLYPHLVPLVDYEFRDDGSGVKLHLWPESEPLPDEQAIKLAEVHLAQEALRGRLSLNNDAYSAATQAITANYPQLEKDTWPTQDKESKAWLADPETTKTPWIDRAALTRGIDRIEYLRRTLAKAKQFEMVSSYLTGTRQKYEDQIKAGGDPVLNYAIPPELSAEMQAQSLQIMTTPAADLQGLF